MNSDIIRDRLKLLADQNNGKLTPEIVVNDALQQDSPLHTNAGFEWDQGRAAHNHWISHARLLIRSVRIVIEEQHVQVKSIAYVRDPEVASDVQGYASIAILKTNATLAREALQNEIERAISYLHRAKEIAISLGLEDEFDTIFQTLSLIQNTASQVITIQQQSNALPS